MSKRYMVRWGDGEFKRFAYYANMKKFVIMQRLSGIEVEIYDEDNCNDEVKI